jgi:hypothetical protein
VRRSTFRRLAAGALRLQWRAARSRPRRSAPSSRMHTGVSSLAVLDLPDPDARFVKMPAKHARGRVSSSAKQISTALRLVEPAETIELNHAAVFDAEPSRPMLALSTSPMLVVPAAGDLFEQARKECLGQYPVALQPKRFAISDYQRKPRRSLLKPHRTLPRHRHPAQSARETALPPSNSSARW